jgi:hypothetical protein
MVVRRGQAKSTALQSVSVAFYAASSLLFRRARTPSSTYSSIMTYVNERLDPVR